MRVRLPQPILLLIAGVMACSSCFAQDIRFSQVARVSDDLGGAIGSITQDTQGFLWYSAENGVYKYDGR